MTEQPVNEQNPSPERCGGSGHIGDRDPFYCNCLMTAHCRGEGGRDGGACKLRRGFSTDAGGGVAAAPFKSRPCPGCPDCSPSPDTDQLRDVTIELREAHSSLDALQRELGEARAQLDESVKDSLADSYRRMKVARSDALRQARTAESLTTSLYEQIKGLADSWWEEARVMRRSKPPKPGWGRLMDATDSLRSLLPPEHDS